MGDTDSLADLFQEGLYWAIWDGINECDRLCCKIAHRDINFKQVHLRVVKYTRYTSIRNDRRSKAAV